MDASPHVDPREIDNDFVGLALVLDGVRFGADIALHGRVLVGEKWLRIESVRLDLGFIEAEIGFEPQEVARHTLLGDKQSELLQVLELLHVGISDQDLRFFLKARRHHDGRDIVFDRIEALQRIGAHEEVDLADRQQNAVIHVRPARHDGHVEPVSFVGAVGERLVETAMFGLRHPIGTEADLVERLRLGRHQTGGKTQ